MLPSPSSIKLTLLGRREQEMGKLKCRGWSALNSREVLKFGCLMFWVQEVVATFHVNLQVGDVGSEDGPRALGR